MGAEYSTNTSFVSDIQPQHLAHLKSSLWFEYLIRTSIYWYTTQAIGWDLNETSATRALGLNNPTYVFFPDTRPQRLGKYHWNTKTNLSIVVNYSEVVSFLVCDTSAWVGYQWNTYRNSGLGVAWPTHMFFSGIQSLGWDTSEKNSIREVEYATTTTLFLFWYFWPHHLGWMTMRYPQKLKPWVWIPNKHIISSGIRPQHLETQALVLNPQHFSWHLTPALGSHTNETHTETQALASNYNIHNMCFVGSDASAWVGCQWST